MDPKTGSCEPTFRIIIFLSISTAAGPELGPEPGGPGPGLGTGGPGPGLGEPGPGPGGKEGGGYVKLFAPGVLGILPALGIKGKLFQRIRVGFPPDQFKVHVPGLNGIDKTVSFESVKYPMFFLQRKGRDIFLESLKRNPLFCK